MNHGAYTSDLPSVMSFIASRIPLNPTNYPPLQVLEAQHALAFNVSHSAMHLTKSLGALAAEVERAHHGGSMDKVALERAALKLFVNSLNLARVLGLTGDDILARLPEVVK